jgi:hypothetical protein
MPTPYAIVLQSTGVIDAELGRMIDALAAPTSPDERKMKERIYEARSLVREIADTAAEIAADESRR